MNIHNSGNKLVMSRSIVSSVENGNFRIQNILFLIVNPGNQQSLVFCMIRQMCQSAEHLVTDSTIAPTN